MATATLLDFRNPHLLRNKKEYKAALAEVECLMGNESGDKAGDRLEFLVVLIEQYEDEHYPMGKEPTPQAVVEFMLEQREMTRSDLAEIMGGKARVSEFFAGKRELSINQVRALRDALGIPADLLIASQS
jgi:HTH-type transcriptional regulator / antitoxin HigA